MLYHPCILKVFIIHAYFGSTMHALYILLYLKCSLLTSCFWWGCVRVLRYWTTTARDATTSKGLNFLIWTFCKDMNTLEFHCSENSFSSIFDTFSRPPKYISRLRSFLTPVFAPWKSVFHTPLRHVSHWCPPAYSHAPVWLARDCVHLTVEQKFPILQKSDWNTTKGL